MIFHSLTFVDSLGPDGRVENRGRRSRFSTVDSPRDLANVNV